ncbi:mechanosensitive ion channel family protein [Alteribacter keqinensis]|uniref:Mechanosensitive ion channel family protein n=1 Tax=Alteribacter keqinensis TaxID=2483800 RepID=A0A3M7TW81_9BACI|nr:mechanosensitive ion channel family protein [Alteribacter keqinensis]RNA69816.1 mechanosensitive ion channel family protein [Alteribacter keqinensis]
MNDWLSSFTWEALLLAAALLILQLVGIFVVYLIVRAVGRRIISSSFDRMSKQRNMTPGRTKTLEKLSLNIFSYVLLFVFITIIIGLFDYDVTALIAGAGIVGLAIGFGAQGLVSDVVTGFFLLLEKQVEVDEYVTIAGIDGVVEEVGLRTTRIRGFDGTVHYIPNREIGSLSNHTRGNMRALVDIGISYDDNIDHAMKVIQDVCDRIAAEDETVVEGPNVLGVQSLDDSDVVIRVIAKTINMEQWGLERKLRKSIKEALDANGIDIPFPHQVYIQKEEK